jgi:cytochrome c-type biogenesis protein CcmH
MTIWPVIALVAGLAGLWIALPLLRRGAFETGEGERAISIYRDQIDELEREREAGLLAPDALAAARREIEARAARAARSLGLAPSLGRPRPLAAAAVAIAVAMAGAGIYAVLGSPASPDRPLALRQEESLTRLAEAGDPAARALIAEREVAEEGDTLDAWWTIGRLRSEAGDHPRAAEAYRKALALSGNAPGVVLAYAEALTLANGNRVPVEARILFEQVLQDRPLDPRARYYTGLARAQEKDFAAALDIWHALYLDTPPDASYAAMVRRDVVNMARFTGRDLRTLLPDAQPGELALAATPLPGAPDAADETPEAEIARLAARIDAGEAGYEETIRLAELHAAAGRVNEGLAVLDRAARDYAGAPFVLERIRAARRALDAPAGPSDADVAAAAGMTEDERDEMISGMVSGLAARLAETPDDLDGWLMLIRSHAVLQDAEAAAAAASRALAHFGRDGEAGRRVIAEASSFGIAVP